MLAAISHPSTRHALPNRILWAFCVYVEAVSVAPQVVLMQQNKTVEKFTGHYVFFLGVARFFSCAHWILQMFDSRGSQLWVVRSRPHMYVYVRYRVASSFAVGTFAAPERTSIESCVRLLLRAVHGAGIAWLCGSNDTPALVCRR